MSIVLGHMNRLAMAIAATALLTMMMVGVADVVLTSFFGTAVPSAVELSESLLVAVVFLPIAWTQSRGQSIAMGFLRPMLPRPARRALDLTIALAGMAFFGLLAWQTWQVAARSVATREFAAGLIAFPLYPAKILLALGVSLAALQFLHDAVAAIAHPED